MQPMPPASNTHDMVAAELDGPVDPRVPAIAAAIAALYPSASRAILFYGSCLRESRLEGLMLDFYLIVSSYRDAFGRSWLAAANRLVPPNVFPFEHDGLTAKYAVLSEEDFERECGVRARSVSVWARFAQPSRLVWARDSEARARAVSAVADAAPTLFSLTRPTLSIAERGDPLAVFRAGFALTYGAELRAERVHRPSSIVDADPERYERIGRAVLETGNGTAAIPSVNPAAARRAWSRRQAKGKLLSVVRLLKAGGTYAGGVDYLAWKINRHAGTRIVVKPWQRRWPLLAAITLLPRLLRRGAIR
jgi:hypothetical protein